MINLAGFVQPAARVVQGGTGNEPCTIRNRRGVAPETVLENRLKQSAPCTLASSDSHTGARMTARRHKSSAFKRIYEAERRMEATERRKRYEVEGKTSGESKEPARRSENFCDETSSR